MIDAEHLIYDKLVYTKGYIRLYECVDREQAQVSWKVVWDDYFKHQGGYMIFSRYRAAVRYADDREDLFESYKEEEE